MKSNSYRVDEETGALIFPPASPEEKLLQGLVENTQTLITLVEALTEKVEILQGQVQNLQERRDN